MKRCVLIFLCCLVFPLTAMAQEAAQELGLRGGVDYSSGNESYTAGELYYQYDLPWKMELSPGAFLFTRLDAGIGYLHADSRSGNWLAIGGDVVLSTAGGLLEFEVGFRPTWLSRDKFGDDDFGGALQFASHAGVALNLGRVVVNYRFQHLSNADVYDENDGLDLHLVGLGVHF